MLEEIMKKNLERIEKLLIDGQKEILDEVRGNSRRIDALDKKLERIDKKHDTNAQALYDLLQDTNQDVKRIEYKLDEHIKQPVHA